MESTQQRCPLVFYFIFTSLLLPGAFSDKELRRGVYNGDTIKVLAYNVSIFLLSGFARTRLTSLKCIQFMFCLCSSFPRCSPGNQREAGIILLVVWLKHLWMMPKIILILGYCNHF